MDKKIINDLRYQYLKEYGGDCSHCHHHAKLVDFWILNIPFTHGYTLRCKTCKKIISVKVYY